MLEWILLTLFIFLNVLDAILTGKIVAAGGRELWAPQRWIMEAIGMWQSLIVTKLVACSGVGVLAWYVPGHHTLLVLLYFLVLMFGFVVANNAQVLKNLRK